MFMYDHSFQAPDMPYVSILVPVKNEEFYIRGILEKLLEQVYPKDKMEIIVIDGLSRDKTRKIVSEFSRENHHIKLIDNPKEQRAAAMNVGIKASKGDILVRVDARTLIPSDYVSKCIQALLFSCADNAGGIQKPIAKSFMQEAIGMAMSHPFGVGNAQFRIGKKSGFVDTVYLGCFRRDVFERVGFFEEDCVVISEDSDMNYRIRKAGGKIYFDKNIVAYYYPREDLKSLAKLYFRYGGAKAGNLLKRGRLTSLRQIVPPLFVLSFLLLPLLSFFHLFFFRFFLGVLGIYVLVDMMVSFWLVRNNEKGPRFFLYLIAIFPSMHFSWGLGFWRRLFQKTKKGYYWGY